MSIACPKTDTVIVPPPTGNFPAKVNSNTMNNTAGITSLPGNGVTVTDPATGTNIRCLTNSGTHAYSTRSGFNADATLYGLAGGAIYRVSDDVFVAQTPTNTEWVFDLTDPNILFGVSGGDLKRYNISSGLTTSLGVPGTTIGDFEGAVSTNRRVLMVNGGNLQTWNLEPVSMIGSIGTPANFDWGGVSNDGNYVYVDTTGGAQAGFVYSISFGLIATIPQDTGHGDFGVDCSGNQVFAYIDNVDGKFKYIVLSTGSVVTLPYTQISGRGHWSGHNTGRPGWIYGDFHQGGGAGGNGFIGAVELCPGSNTQEPWTNLEPFYTDDVYANQLKPTVSADGKRIMVTSSASGNPRDYMIWID